MEVLVLARDAQLDVLRLQALGHGRDEVVRLVPLELEDGQPQRLDDLADALVLHLEVLGRAVAVRLVLGVEALAKRRGVAHVERDGQVVWALVADDVEEHLREDVDGLDGLARRAGEVAERRVVGAEELRVTVDDVEGLHACFLTLRFAGGGGARVCRHPS